MILESPFAHICQLMSRDAYVNAKIFAVSEVPFKWQVSCQYIPLNLNVITFKRVITTYTFLCNLFMSAFVKCKVLCKIIILIAYYVITYVSVAVKEKALCWAFYEILNIKAVKMCACV